MYILPYTLLHFYRLYPKARHFGLNYGAGAGEKVSVQKYTGSFFDEKRPRPQQVIWKEWRGEKLPFFFEEDDTAELITYFTDGSVSINYDIIASAFYLLSGWQEYYGTERDRFDRYPYRASVQAMHSFITKPVVNYYFEILREAVERVHGVDLQHDYWGNNSFATCLTCDVDRLQSAWKAAGLQRLKAGQLSDLTALLLRKAVGKDAWFNLSEVIDTAARHNARLSFFFLPDRRRYQSYPNADYDIADPVYQELIKYLTATGHEVGVHGSFGTAASAAQLQSEAGRLPVAVQGNRFHYLCYDPRLTPKALQQSSLRYDTTLGFAEHFGFRNSYCHPFYPFDFEKRSAHTYLELPLLLMDTTLYSPSYMHLKPSRVLGQLEPMLQEVIRFRGLFTLLWHNENFSRFSEYPVPAGEPAWCKVLQQLLQQVQAGGTAFLTCSEAASLAGKASLAE